jgi:hypothetical protein
VEIDRRRHEQARMVVDPEWASGWLAFQTLGEKRRLASYPFNWTALSSHELEHLLQAATVVQPSRRLIE